MSKLNIESDIYSDQENQISLGHFSVDEESAVFECPKCGALKGTRSRQQRYDQLKAIFFPAVPYRCLRCYHRFWRAESVFANKYRAVVLSLLALMVVGVLGFLLLNLFSQTSLPAPTISDDQIETPSAVASNGAVVADPGLLRSADKPEPLDGVAPTTAATLGSGAANNPTGGSAVVIETASSLEEQKRQVKLAKQQAELAAKVSQNKLAQIESSLAPDLAERQSLAKVEVSYTVEQWRDAWASGDADKYLAYYSQSFQPNNGLSLAQWKLQRRARVAPKKKINLLFSSFDVSFDEPMNTGIVEFEQLYSAGEYSETSRKRLILSKEVVGWKIVSETEID